MKLRSWLFVLTLLCVVGAFVQYVRRDSGFEDDEERLQSSGPALVEWLKSEQLFAVEPRLLPVAGSPTSDAATLLVGEDSDAATLLVGEDSDCAVVIDGTVATLYSTGRHQVAGGHRFTIAATRAPSRQAISPECTRLALPGEGGAEGGLWDLETLKQIRSLPAGVVDAAFSREGHWLALRTTNNVEVWDADMRERITQLPKSPMATWSPFKALLGVVDSSGALSLWDANLQDKYCVLTRTEGASRVVFSYDGLISMAFVTDERGRLSKLVFNDMRSGWSVGEIAGLEDVVDAAITHDGGRVAAVSKSIRVWQMNTDQGCNSAEECQRHAQLMSDLRRPSSPSLNSSNAPRISFSADGTLALISDVISELRQANDGKTVFRFPRQMSQASFSHSGDSVIAFDGVRHEPRASMNLRAWRTPRSRLVEELFGSDAAFVGLQRRWLAVCGAGGLQIKSIPGLAQVGRVPSTAVEHCRAIVSSSDGLRAVVRFDKGFEIFQFHEPTSGGIVADSLSRISCECEYRGSMDIGPDDRTVLVADHDSDAPALKVWKGMSWRVLVEGRGVFPYMHSVGFSSDGDVLAFGYESRTASASQVTPAVVRINVESGQVVDKTRLSEPSKWGGWRVLLGGVLSDVDAGPQQVTSPDGKTVLLDLPAVTQGVRQVRVSKDRTLIYVSGSDGVVHVWDPTAKRQVGTLQAHSRSIEKIDLGHDDGYLATVGDTRIKIWKMKGRPLADMARTAGFVRYYSDPEVR